jgi:hypothetical protein
MIMKRAGGCAASQALTVEPRMISRQGSVSMPE